MIINNPAAGTAITAGSYAGDNADDKQIAVGFKCSLVIIWKPSASKSTAMLISINAANCFLISTQALESIGTKLDPTDGFRVRETTDRYNTTGTTYNYFALGE